MGYVHIKRVNGQKLNILVVNNMYILQYFYIILKNITHLPLYIMYDYIVDIFLPDI